MIQRTRILALLLGICACASENTPPPPAAGGGTSPPPGPATVVLLVRDAPSPTPPARSSLAATSTAA